MPCQLWFFFSVCASNLTWLAVSTISARIVERRDYLVLMAHILHPSYSWEVLFCFPRAEESYQIRCSSGVIIWNLEFGMEFISMGMKTWIFQLYIHWGYFELPSRHTKQRAELAHCVSFIIPVYLRMCS